MRNLSKKFFHRRYSLSTIRVIGGGFAGLTAAWALQRNGHVIEIFESQARWGGFLETRPSIFGRYECAANGILNSMAVEELLRDLDLKAHQLPPAARQRFIYFDQPRRWPLSTFESLQFAFLFLVQRCSGKWKPGAGESLFHWAKRVGGEGFAKKVVAPAVLGIYAIRSDRLSARLVLQRWLRSPGPKRTKYRGTLFPEGGMSALVEKLTAQLERRGAQLHLNSPVKGLDLTVPTVIATSANVAASLLSDRHRELSQLLSQVEYVPLCSVQVFAEESPIRGFGMLFSEESRFRALGVLADHHIFSGQMSLPSERWILGGDRQPEVMEMSDLQIIEQVESERKRLGARGKLRHIELLKWKSVVPVYDIRHEDRLLALKVPSLLRLHGNYMGSLGLSGMLERSIELSGSWS